MTERDGHGAAVLSVESLPEAGRAEGLGKTIDTGRPTPRGEGASTRARRGGIGVPLTSSRRTTAIGRYTAWSR